MPLTVRIRRISHIAQLPHFAAHGRDGSGAPSRPPRRSAPSEQVVLVGPGRRRGPAAHPGLGEDVLEVPADGVRADRQRTRRSRGWSCPRPPGPAPRARGATARRRPRCRRSARRSSSQVDARPPATRTPRGRCRTRARPRRGRRARGTRVRAAPRPAPPRRACAAAATPGSQPAGAAARRAGSPTRQRHRPAGLLRHRAQHRRRRLLCDGGQLRRRVARLGGLARGDEDVHGRGQQAGRWNGCARLEQGAPDARDRGGRRRLAPVRAAPAPASAGSPPCWPAGTRRRPHRAHPAAGAAPPPGSTPSRAPDGADRRGARRPTPPSSRPSTSPRPPAGAATGAPGTGPGTEPGRAAPRTTSSSAAVHSAARARSKICMHSRITAQYTIPDDDRTHLARSSPPASPRRSGPAAPHSSPIANSAWPWPSIDERSEVASPKRSAMSTACTARSRARSRRPSRARRARAGISR